MTNISDCINEISDALVELIELRDELRKAKVSDVSRLLMNFELSQRKLAKAVDPLHTLAYLYVPDILNVWVFSMYGTN
jgi:hypothetical protein